MAVSDAEIKAYINQPGRTSAEIYAAAQANGVSNAQVANAMGNTGAFTLANINNYTAAQQPKPTVSDNVSGYKAPAIASAPAASMSDNATGYRPPASTSAPAASQSDNASGGYNPAPQNTPLAQNTNYSNANFNTTPTAGSVEGMGGVYSDQYVKDFINQPGMTSKGIYEAATKYGITDAQLSRSGGGKGAFSMNNIAAFRAHMDNGGTEDTFQSDDAIKAYVNTEGRTEAEIANAMKQYGVSAERLAQVMGNTGVFALDNIKRYLDSQELGGAPYVVPSDRTFAPETLDPLTPIAAQNINKQSAVTSTDASSQNVAFDQSTQTVQGQLNSALDPNSQLMQRAATYGKQQANAKGMLNSSMATTAAQAAMIDAGLQIATPDAQSANARAGQDAQLATDVNKQNAQNSLTANMFSSDQNAAIDQRNAELSLAAATTNIQKAFETGTFNVSQLNEVGFKNLDNYNAQRLADLNNKHELALNASNNAAQTSIDLMKEVNKIASDGLPNSQERTDLAFDLADRALKIQRSFSDLADGLDFSSAGGGGDTVATGLGKPPSGTSSSSAPSAPNGLASSAGTPNVGATAAGGDISKMTNKPLGDSGGVFQTLNMQIAKGAADFLRDAYGIEPKYLVNLDRQANPNGVATLYDDEAREWYASPMGEIGFYEKARAAMADGTITKIGTRDPKYGMPFDKSVVGIESNNVYYDPNNVLGLR